MDLESKTAQLGRTIHGVPEAFVDVDLITTMIVAEFVEKRATDGLTQAERIAIKAIMGLAEHDAHQARTLATELNWS